MKTKIIKRKKLFKLNLYCIIVCIMYFLLSCTSNSNKNLVDSSVRPKISSYIRTWPLGSGIEIDKGKHWTANMIVGGYLSDLIIGFAHINPADGYSLYVKDMLDQESQNTSGLIIPGFYKLWDEVAALKKKYTHLKINISVGGYGVEGFSDMADNIELKNSFIKNVCDWLEKYNLDGVDIDWEYPVGHDWGQEIKSKLGDKENYITLLSDLRIALDNLGEKNKKTYGLSTAVPASNWFVEKNDVVAVSEIVDSIKLMSYDYYGGWSLTTGHNANLYQNSNDPAWGGWSTDQAVNAYLNAGVSANKIVLGLAFYGRAWTGVSDGGTNGLYQTYKTVLYEDGLAWDKITEFLKPNSGYTRYWDDIAKAPYLYDGNTFITYTDPEQIVLINDYVHTKGLGGIMIWEYAHDIKASLLRVLVENTY